jgi:NitT/TauT family transport system substrate-binding protein
MLRWFHDPANHKEAVEVIARLLKRPPAMLEDWLFTKKDFYRVLDGKPDLKVIQESIEKVKELGFIKETVDVSKYADLSFIEEAARRRRNGN